MMMMKMTPTIMKTTICNSDYKNNNTMCKSNNISHNDNGATDNNHKK